MATFLFQNIIFGPVSSRRLGSSLGINLLPGNRKVCNFNCIYCECGWTGAVEPEKAAYPAVDEFVQALQTKLTGLKIKGVQPDTITFAGNGEPTLHPDFALITDETIRLRNEFTPGAKIAVLTNGTGIQKEGVFNALLKIDQNIIKLDSSNPDMITKINQPRNGLNLESLIEGLKRFDGRFILQSLFFRGTYRNVHIDNTTDEEIRSWLEVIKEVRPQEVMIYTFHRDTPERGLTRISRDELDGIAARVKALGVKTLVTA